MIVFIFNLINIEEIRILLFLFNFIIGDCMKVSVIAVEEGWSSSKGREVVKQQCKLLYG